MASQRNIVFILALMAAVLMLTVTYHHFNVNGLDPRISLGLGSSRGKPRYIFVDLGANKGDSLDVFLGNKDGKFDYKFPCPGWSTPRQAEIYLFEANPVFNTPLVEAKEKYQKLGHKIHIFPSTVVDVRDGTRTFFLDTVNTANDFWGSSVYADHPDVVRSGSNGTELTAINISRWLLMNMLPRDYVVVKMDIEGSEYEVIPHMVNMGVWSVVDYLLVEWHGIPENVEGQHAFAKAAAEKLVKEGVKMPEYNSPA